MSLAATLSPLSFQTLKSRQQVFHSIYLHRHTSNFRLRFLPFQTPFRLQASRRISNSPQGSDTLVDDPRSWSRSISSEYSRHGDDEDDDDDDEEEEEKKMMIKVLFVACFLTALAVAQHPADWHGSWTANNRYGGVMYSCPVGNTLYGVYSNAGFFEGTISGRTVEGNYWEGGRGYRNDYQGSFRITLAADNNEFDGFYTRVSEDGEERRWHETRLGAPFPPQPSHDQCLVPDMNANLGGGFYRENKQHATQYICRDNYAQVYGSFSEPNGYLEGWSVRNNTGFHGYRYEGNGNEGAYILRAVAENVARGFYWKGRVVHSQNIELTTEDVLYRSHEDATFEECEQFGPGFLTRLRAPNSAASLSAGLVTLVVALLSVLFF